MLPPIPPPSPMNNPNSPESSMPFPGAESRLPVLPTEAMVHPFSRDTSCEQAQAMARPSENYGRQGALASAIDPFFCIM
ncbi:hypothetical protein MRB53_015628 [Persea americana]|uniref:Uncharacterized protein n=1 Tax=Persea americana TaxID=3435 RepID=A0ACC2LZR6_PERAE|nr:hypothetical protein MRB53_015628 [Persea americana]